MVKRFFFAALLAGLLPVFPVSAANLTILYENETPFELVSIRATLETTRGMRNTHSRVNLARGGAYSIGVNGAVKPLRIQVEFAAGRLEFDDLSGLRAEEDMRLAVIHDESGTRLEQAGTDDPPRAAQGRAVWFLNDGNRPNAVSKAVIVKAENMDDVRRMVKDAVSAAGGGQKQASFAVEAGPIWNNDHAGERCPELLKEWSGTRGPGEPEARWAGGWSTTVPDQMSVCVFLAGPAGIEDTLFEEDEGKKLAFPVAWGDTVGVGQAAPLSDDSPDIAVLLRLALKENTLRAVFEDLAKEGYRPWTADVRKRRIEDGVVLRYGKGGKDAEADWAGLFETLAAARGDCSLHDAAVVLVSEKSFRDAAEDKKPAPAPGVLLRCGPGNVEAVFVPDGSILMH